MTAWVPRYLKVRSLFVSRPDLIGKLAHSADPRASYILAHWLTDSYLANTDLKDRKNRTTEEAVRWLRLGAAKGLGLSEILLAQWTKQLLQADIRPEMDRIKAHLQLLAKAGDSMAAYALGDLLRDAVASGQKSPRGGWSLGPESVQLALPWFCLAAESGIVPAESMCATWTKDLAQRHRLMQAASDAGDAKASFDLSYDYQSGNGIPKDETQSKIYRCKAAWQGGEGARYWWKD